MHPSSCQHHISPECSDPLPDQQRLIGVQRDTPAAAPPRVRSGLRRSFDYLLGSASLTQLSVRYASSTSSNYGRYRGLVLILGCINFIAIGGRGTAPAYVLSGHPRTQAVLAVSANLQPHVWLRRTLSLCLIAPQDVL